MTHYSSVFLVVAFMLLPQNGLSGTKLPLRQSVLEEADRILNLANVSYVYGGKQLGHSSHCDACTSCLSEKVPQKNRRLEVCPVCRSCSLDCSHFVSLVFTQAGLRAPYLTTSQMRDLPTDTLRRRYGWVNLGNRASRALPGDLLVYPGHVVIVEKVIKPGTGHVVHATSGKEVRGPGQGIQRQTLVTFKTYKGPLQKVLRHESLLKELRRTLSPKYGVRSKL
ncbi:NlpC/P60 family protein [Pseudobacteriovorax antillogorgiicola]|uniref:NlpC/P60 family protein n=1 Tax=Pseudobacteriovorax antillogorgiicola TaxID=1513793 RepID=A0A1Y6BCS1_9BACT|nr:NlpC/P60 family protein [Pseudobacteriovorax antillogorgiicola]TCS58575.1 NlpC/P60 family protein [Pseudobacteriovorax antillogorgiicola]SME97344.1 NlpC/P60 family protein [Pseudobacteriovorax antillogorgiicola]